MSWKRPFGPESTGGGGGGVGGTMTDAEVLAALNRTTGPVSDTALGNRTADQTLVNPANTGPLSSVLSWLAGAVKGITGETDWKNVPATTLKTLKTRADAHEGSRDGHPVATTTLAGLMVGADKAKLDTTLAVAGPEVTLSAATTLTTAALEKMHALSGSMNYTVTLPAAAGNAGKVIGFRVSGTATALVTLGANASETIDGLLTRVMWAQESAILLCDGVGWTKISGKSRPMACGMRLVPTGGATAQTSQAISHNIVTKVLLNQTDYDDGSLADLANNQVGIRRSGKYQIEIFALYSPFGATVGMPRCLVNATRLGDGSRAVQVESSAYSSASHPTASRTATADMASGVALQMQTFQNSGETRYLAGDPTLVATLMAVVEVVQW